MFRRKKGLQNAPKIPWGGGEATGPLREAGKNAPAYSKGVSGRRLLPCLGKKSSETKMAEKRRASSGEVVSHCPGPKATGPSGDQKERNHSSSRHTSFAREPAPRPKEKERRLRSTSRSQNLFGGKKKDYHRVLVKKRSLRWAVSGSEKKRPPFHPESSEKKGLPVMEGKTTTKKKPHKDTPPIKKGVLSCPRKRRINNRG